MKRVTYGPQVYYQIRLVGWDNLFIARCTKDLKEDSPLKKTLLGIYPGVEEVFFIEHFNKNPNSVVKSTYIFGNKEGDIRDASVIDQSFQFESSEDPDLPDEEVFVE